MTLNFGSFPTFLTLSLDINVFRLSAVISSKLFKLIVFPLFPSTVSAPCAWLFYGSSNNAGTLRAWPLCPLILEWDPFFKWQEELMRGELKPPGQSPEAEILCSSAVEAVKCRMLSCSFRLESLRMMTTCDSCSLVWTGQTWVERPRSLTCVKHRSSRSLWRLSALIGFFLLVSPSLRSVSVHLTRNFHSNFYHKEKCVHWIKTFSSNVLHQDTVCISVFSVNRFKFKDAGKNCIQSLWKSWRSKFI